jgi:CspA family cold shock protein
MANGVVKHFDLKTGYGFIEPSDGTKFVFVHRIAVENSGLESLFEGQKVQYELVPEMDGKSAAENLGLLD